MTTDAVEQLRTDARELHGVLRRQARRPFVLEITGTPKAGKTTLIALLKDFLRECGWRVNDEVFLSVRRRQPAQLPSGRDDSGRLWQGCHIEHPGEEPLALAEVERQLRQRLQTDLHLGQLQAAMEPLGLIWDRNGADKRHLGVVFKVTVDEKIANFLDEKEFRTNGRGHRVESSFASLSELASGKLPPEGYTLEPWSLAFLEKKWLP